MTGIRISELPALTATATGDLLEVTDVSDGSSKKVELKDLYGGVFSTESGNLIVRDTNGAARLTLSDINSTDAGNLLASGTDSKIRLSQTDATSSDANNVLTSGSDGKLFVPNQSGGSGNFTQTFVAEGNASDGDVAVLRDNGNVSIVSEDLTMLNASELSEAISGDTRENDMVYIPDGNKVAAAYVLAGSGVRLVIGTIIGNTITWGTPISLTNTSGNGRPSINYDTQNDVVIVRYNYSTQGRIRTATISGNTPTLVGTELSIGTTFNSASKFYKLANNKFVLFSTNSTQLHTRVITVNNNTGGVGTGTTQTFNITGVNLRIAQSAFSINGNQVLALLADVNTNTENLHLRVGNFAGDVITWETNTLQVETGTTQNADMVYSSTDDKYVFAYIDNQTPNRVCNANTATVINNTISAGTKIVLDATAGGGGDAISLAYDGNKNRSFIIFDGSPVTDELISSLILDSSQNNLSAGILKTFDKQCYHTSAIYNTSDENFVGIAATELNGSSSRKLEYSVFSYGSNAGDYIGIFQGDATNGANCQVTVIGGVAENLTGLTINRDYYVADDGTLTLTVNSRPIGRAIKATAMTMNRR